MDQQHATAGGPARFGAHTQAAPDEFRVYLVDEPDQAHHIAGWYISQGLITHGPFHSERDAYRHIGLSDAFLTKAGVA